MIGEAILTDLKRGAEACLRNSERLLHDAQKLLGMNGNTSSFVLYLSALEELGKGFILSEKVEKQERLSEQEWKNIIGRDGHIKKLCEFYRARDSSDERMLRTYGLDYPKILEKMAKSQGNKDLKSCRQQIARQLHNLRMAETYVDFKDGTWKEPQPLERGHIQREIIIVRKDVEELKSKINLVEKLGARS